MEIIILTIIGCGWVLYIRDRKADEAIKEID